MRMPRPPPPSDALMSTGYPSASATTPRPPRRTAPSLPGTRGTSALRASSRARILLPSRRIASGRADELDVAGAADLGEVRVLAEEAVAGVDRLGVGDLGGGDEARDVEVALGAVLGSDADALVGEADGERAGVGRRVRHDGQDPHLPARAKDPERDLPAVGDQDLGEHQRVSSGRRRPGGAPRRPRR